jgi:hypothetical protein
MYTRNIKPLQRLWGYRIEGRNHLRNGLVSDVLSGRYLSGDLLPIAGIEFTPDAERDKVSAAPLEESSWVA